MFTTLGHADRGRLRLNNGALPEVIRNGETELRFRLAATTLARFVLALWTHE